MYKKILFMVLIMSQWSLVNSQTISRQSISSAGSTLTGGSYMLTFNIGETVIPTLSSGGTVISEGFEQPGEQIQTGIIPAVTCVGTVVNVPFIASDLLATNTYTAQLSNATGSFASPVNIGTLAGNSKTGTIVATIPVNTPGGSGYKIRVVGSVPLTIGTSSATITLNPLPVVSIIGILAAYCRTAPAITLQGSPTGGVFKLDGTTATVLDASALSIGQHDLTYTYTNANGCTNTTGMAVTINGGIHIPDPNFAAAIRIKCPTCIDACDNLTPAAANLRLLDVGTRNISDLTGIEGFTNLKDLNCAINNLQLLPNNLPRGLEILYCYGNQLRTLPNTLPNSLKYLLCHNNQLEALPNPLPTSLEDLRCFNNRIRFLPDVLPTNLNILHCFNNQLTNLPNTLPTGLQYLYCEGNDIYCLPPVLPNLWLLRLDADKITCTPQAMRAIADASNRAVTMPICRTSCSGTIPVELTSFTGKADNNVNKLHWEVATQINVSHYNIERSADGSGNWTSIGRVEAQKGSKSALFYNFDDQKPWSLSYYRLVIVDVDGKLSYSKVISLNQEGHKLAIQNVYPNPFSNVLNIKLDAPQAAQTTVTITDILGRTLLTERFTARKGENTWAIDAHQLTVGTYFIIANDGQTPSIVKIVKH
jgi:Secretion system C-terminal sorting domain